MTEQDEELRAVFDGAIAASQDPDRNARLELLREYFTNPDFARRLHDVVWDINQRNEAASSPTRRGIVGRAD